jgi:hypothetical protein
MLNYSVKLKDPIIETEVNNSPVTFSYRGVFTKTVKLVDGEVAISLTGLNTIKALYISTNEQINVKLNSGSNISVAKTLFTELNGLSALSISCTSATGASVTIIVWGE